MADRAVGQMGVVNILVRERGAALVLIVGRLPRRVEYIGSNAQIRRWVAVTIETPRHCQRRGGRVTTWHRRPIAVAPCYRTERKGLPCVSFESFS